MTVSDRAALRDQLIRAEGLRLKPYRCPAGKLTIGVGRNLDDVGISEAEAIDLLDHDIDTCIKQLVTWPWFIELDAIRQRALVDLCFNLGFTGLSKFVNALQALQQHDYEIAGDAFQQSAWFRQVGGRGARLVAMIRTGQEPA